jgi:hypothetical protein
VIDFSSLKQLHVQATEAANVWRVSLPMRPWRFDSAERERQSRVLWLSDWASEDRPGWRYLAEGELLWPPNEELASGAWVLFFFERDPGASFDAAPVPTLPADAASAAHALRRFGADAAIWSWYDDNEWLIAVKKDGRAVC